MALSSCTNAPRSVEYRQLTDPTGCVIEQMTSAAFDEYQVQGASRDGRLLSIAWSKGDDEQGNPIRGAYTLNLTTGEKNALDDQVNNSGTFSPDAQHLVLAAWDDSGRTEIVELDTTAGTTRIIAPQPDAWDWLPSYSADGRFIVFNSDRVGKQMDIYVFERATGSIERMTDYDGYDAHAQFSPDGGRILFHRMQSTREGGGYDFDLYLIDVESGTETRLTDGPFEESYPAFAPDGKHIVFSSDVDQAPEKHDLYVRAPDGTVTALTNGDWKDSYAYWTPDGKYIYFNSDRSGTTDVYRMPMAGVACRQ